MNSVLDASALLAFLLQEQGHAQVMDAIVAETCMCTVNFAEVAAFYARHGRSATEVRLLAERLAFPLIDMEVDLAVRAAMMAPAAGAFGLTLAGRACLALAERLGVPALTADPAWVEAGATLGVAVRMIR